LQDKAKNCNNKLVIAGYFNGRVICLNVGQAARLSILFKFQKLTPDIYKKEIKNV